MPLLLAIILWIFSYQTQPIIVQFSADISSISPEAAESGVYPITLTWRTIRMSDDQSLRLEAFVLDGWINALPDDAPPLSISGSLEHTVPHSLTFMPPTLRLVILDEDEEIITSRALIIPYSYDVSPETQPDIIGFEATSDLYQNTLEAGEGVVNVHWEVLHRPPNSNLVFEQIMPDEQTINVEFPRDYLWVRSEGEGKIQPVLVNEDQLWLRLSLIDITTHIVYDIQEIPVSILLPPVSPVQLPLPTRTPSNEPDILRFNANTLNAHPGDVITLSWETRLVDRVEIISGDVMLSVLPLNGSQEVMIPIGYTANTITFILMANQTISAEVSVNIIQEAP